jgi:hypothetical protein
MFITETYYARSNSMPAAGQLGRQHNIIIIIEAISQALVTKNLEID